MIAHPSHEEWLKKFDAARAKATGDNPDRAAAIVELKALGLTEGDCEYWLSRNKR